MASRFLDEVRANMRMRGYTMSTEKTYLLWIRRYIRFIGNQHPARVSPSEIASYLTFMADQYAVSVNTQKTALNALVFLYEKYLQIEVGKLGFRYAKKQRQLPTALTPAEVKDILATLQGRNRLILQILYGSGLRVGECLGLRVKDIDLQACSLTIVNGKGWKDRKTLLSPQLKPELEKYIELGKRVQQSAGSAIALAPGCVAR